MRTRDGYSPEQLKVWRNKLMSENVIKNASNSVDFISIPVVEITQLEYNRAKSRRGAEIARTTPAFFVAKEDEMLITYATRNGKYYRSIPRVLFPHQESLLLGDKKMSPPEIATELTLTVEGSKWDNAA